jgi:hypothetical protein
MSARDHEQTADAGTPKRAPTDEPAFVGMCDIYGDLHDRADHEHAYQAVQCTWQSLFSPNEGATPPPELLEDIDAYLEPFAAPILIDGKNMCPHCGHPFNGSLADTLLGRGGFEWGLAHGEGHCGCCRWPARLYHFIKDRHGAELMTFRHLVLAYLPDDGAGNCTASTTDADRAPGTTQERAS